MSINPFVKNRIVNFINFRVGNFVTVDEIRINSPGDASLAEIAYVLTEGEEKGCLKRARIKNMDGYHVLELLPNEDDRTEVTLVVSRPKRHRREFSEVQLRNGQIDTLDCFKDIIASTKSQLRISSPFIQKNVTNEESFPEFEQLLRNAMLRGVRVKILSRELFEKREMEARWLKNIAEKCGTPGQLSVRDYHFQLPDESPSILSSTHAKMLIADQNMAYIGSGELRMNSLIVNFEVGCLLKGAAVIGAIEAFDTMFERGTPYE